jgi:endonuclease YncB( thermonuclease family)
MRWPASRAIGWRRHDGPADIARRASTAPQVWATTGIQLGSKSQRRQAELDADVRRQTLEMIRLWGIDAPEGDQVCQRAGRQWGCGDDATAALEALVDRHELTCEAP